MEKDYYRIIDIQEVSNIYHWEKAILVKANKAKVVMFNGKPRWFTYTSNEDASTDWFVFKFSERKLRRLIEAAKQCDANELWCVEKHIFTPLPTPISDDGKNFVKTVYFTIMHNDEYDYTDIHEGVYDLSEDNDDLFGDNDDLVYDYEDFAEDDELLEDLCYDALCSHEIDTDLIDMYDVD